MNKQTMYRRTFDAVVLSILLAPPIFAQSTITLDSFDLRQPTPGAVIPERAVEPRGVSSCLFNAEACADGEARGRAFSLDDVVNLGIVNRQEVSVAETPDAEVAVKMAAPLPSVDLEVLFEYGSDQLSNSQIGDLYALVRELRAVDFTGRRLVLMGHTDAAGSATYNRDLSLRRAMSVADFLSREAGIPRDRIRTAGMGFDYLAYPENPLDGVNRRVQILLIEG
jgi:OOP family OmpA-OmpF porin